MTTFTRQELYRLVWSESRLSLGKRLGVSDVWIRKACVSADIPVPPPGYWTMSPTKKTRCQQRLPQRQLGQSDAVTWGTDRFGSVDWDTTPVPPEPVFEEDILTLRARAAALLAKARLPRNLDHAAGPIAKLLMEDAARQRELTENSYSWRKPRFTAPAAQRRLRLLNGLMTVLPQKHFRGYVDKESLDTRLYLHNTPVDVWLYARGRKPMDQWGRATFQLADERRERLVLQIGGEEGMDGIQSEWADTDESKLEDQLLHIAQEVLVCAELTYRDHVIRQRARIIQGKADHARELERRRFEAERKERERRAKHEKAQVDHLLGLATRVRQADDIRRLVSAMTAADPDATGLTQWSQWASAVADGIDPCSQPFADLMVAPNTAEPRNDVPG